MQLFEYGGWVGWGGVGCYNVHVPCVHTWMRRCCYVTDHGLGGVGWSGNVHAPCVHTWMLRCCYVTDHGLGGVGWDGMCKISKGAVSSSWNTREDVVVNPQLLQGIRIWQWRWHHGNSTDLLSLTGKALSKRLETWQAREEKGKGFHPATTTKPCKYHDIPSKSFNFPRENLR